MCHIRTILEYIDHFGIDIHCSSSMHRVLVFHNQSHPNYLHNHLPHLIELISNSKKERVKNRISLSNNDQIRTASPCFQNTFPIVTLELVWLTTIVYTATGFIGSISAKRISKHELMFIRDCEFVFTCNLVFRYTMHSSEYIHHSYKSLDLLSKLSVVVHMLNGLSGEEI